MKKVLVCLLILIGILSCRKEESFNKEEFLAALSQKEWFQQMKVPCDENTICRTYIYMAVYNHEPVVYSIVSGALCDPRLFFQLYNVEGEKVKTYSDEEQLSAFEKEVTHPELIYSCDD
jgi:hypothetical protein